MTEKTPASKENYSQSENKRSEEYGEALSRIDDATKKTPAKIEIEKLLIERDVKVSPDTMEFFIKIFDKGIELGRKESEEENYIDRMSKLERLEKDYLQQLSNQKKEIIEKIEEEWTLCSDKECDKCKLFRRILKQIEGEKK